MPRTGPAALLAAPAAIRSLITSTAAISRIPSEQFDDLDHPQQLRVGTGCTGERLGEPPRRILRL